MIENRYLLFAGDSYYAMSAPHNLISGHGTLDSAMADAARIKDLKEPMNTKGERVTGYTGPVGWWCVLDVKTLEVVEREGEAHGDH